MAKKDEDIIWKKARGDMFETFAVELKEFTQAGRLPSSCDQDMEYCLELQKERQKDKNVIMKYEFVPRGHFAKTGGIGKGWEDERYKTRMEYRTCRWEKMFYKDKKKVHSSKQNSTFYQIITDKRDSHAVEEDSYTCPNCGAISKVRELIDGCSYCGTFFKMEDLFPKVTNFFFIEDISGTDKEVNGDIAKTVVPCMLISMICLTYVYSNQNDNGLLMNLIPGVIAGAILGGVLGYFLWAILKIGYIFAQAGKSASMVVNVSGSAKSFEAKMKKYSPEFSYEYFTSKVISMLKMIIFAKEPQELPIYVGDTTGEMFSDILDSSYAGALALKKFEIQGDYCYVTVDAYMEDIYDGDRVRRKKDVFRIVLRKNITTPIQLNFSIKKIHCKSCGVSFDATKQITCPTCSRKYEIDDEDWVIMQITKK